jgi:hypothetical protein
MNTRTIIIFLVISFESNGADIQHPREILSTCQQILDNIEHDKGCLLQVREALKCDVFDNEVPNIIALGSEVKDAGVRGGLHGVVTALHANKNGVNHYIRRAQRDLSSIAFDITRVLGRTRSEIISAEHSSRL